MFVIPSGARDLQFSSLLVELQIPRGAEAPLGMTTNSGEINSTHGKYIDFKQRRTKENQTRVAQEAQDGESAEAPRVRARIEEAQSEEAGTRSVETVISWDRVAD